jgi:hypothetical protein
MTTLTPTTTTTGPEIAPDVGALFASAPAWQVPGIADRYDYKKDPGSSDTRHQEDDIRT